MEDNSWLRSCAPDLELLEDPLKDGGGGGPGGGGGGGGILYSFYIKTNSSRFLRNQKIRIPVNVTAILSITNSIIITSSQFSIQKAGIISVIIHLY